MRAARRRRATGLLGLRFFRGTPPWWVILLTIFFVGWAAYLLFVVSRFDDLSALVESQDTPDPELVAQATSDGGPLTFALLGGGVISLLYAAPWCALYLCAFLVRRSLARRRRRAG